MDNVTHTLMGIGIANAYFKKQVSPSAVTILAIASNLPDIDAVVHLTGDPSAIFLRRTFGHSLFTLPVLSLLLIMILKRFLPHIRTGILIGLIFLGASIHIFLDLINSFGVVLLWPFSDWRPELAMTFIIDLFLTGILAFPLLLYVMQPMRKHLVLFSKISVICSFIYIIFCGGNRIMAQQVLNNEVNRQKMTPEFIYVFPEPFGQHRWRGIVRNGNTYKIYLINSISGNIELKDEIQTEEEKMIVTKVKSTYQGRQVTGFFKAPVWLAEEGNPAGVMVYDLRFKSVVIQRETPFLFHFNVLDDGRVEMVEK